MIAKNSRFRAVIEEDYPRVEVILAYVATVEPDVHPNAVASMVSQDITDIEARFDVEGPICWRDPMVDGRYAREHRRRAIAERHVARGRR